MKGGSAPPAWSNGFLGIPALDHGRDRAGCDCWGLACIVFRETLDVTLPDYLGYGSVEEHAEIEALIQGAQTSPLWHHVTGHADSFDIAVFRRGRFATHLGIVVRHGLMLHMAARSHSQLADYRHGPWAHRFLGHWRHASRVFETPVQRFAKVPQ